MEAYSAPDTNARKQFAEDIKGLQTDEYHEIFRILKRNDVDFSENTNGIFFDLSQVPDDIFQKLSEYMTLCLLQRQNEKKRTDELESIRTNQLKDEAHETK